MNLKHAAGRNWDHQPRRRRHVTLEPHADPRSAAQPAPLAPAYRQAAGRNWDRERPPRRRAFLRPAEAISAAQPIDPYPLRERGGGDHDEPYVYRRPTTSWPFPFTYRQLARLLALRGRLADQPFRRSGSPDTSSVTSSAAAASR